MFSPPSLLDKYLSLLFSLLPAQHLERWGVDFGTVSLLHVSFQDLTALGLREMLGKRRDAEINLANGHWLVQGASPSFSCGWCWWTVLNVVEGVWFSWNMFSSQPNLSSKTPAEARHHIAHWPPKESMPCTAKGRMPCNLSSSNLASLQLTPLLWASMSTFVTRSHSYQSISLPISIKAMLQIHSSHIRPRVLCIMLFGSLIFWHLPAPGFYCMCHPRKIMFINDCQNCLQSENMCWHQFVLWPFCGLSPATCWEISEAFCLHLLVLSVLSCLPPGLCLPDKTHQYL